MKPSKKEPITVEKKHITKKEIKLKRKLDKILTVLTDEWIEKNIDGVRTASWFRWNGFEYAEVTRDKLVSGARVIESNHGEADFKEHNSMMFFDLFLSGFIFTSVLMFLLLSFRLEPKKCKYRNLRKNYNQINVVVSRMVL